MWRGEPKAGWRGKVVSQSGRVSTTGTVEKAVGGRSEARGSNMETRTGKGGLDCRLEHTAARLQFDLAGEYVRTIRKSAMGDGLYVKWKGRETGVVNTRKARTGKSNGDREELLEET